MSSRAGKAVVQISGRGLASAKVSVSGLTGPNKLEIALQTRFAEDENFRAVVKVFLEKLDEAGPNASVPAVVAAAAEKNKELMHRPNRPIAKSTNSKCLWCGQHGHWYIMCDGFHEALKEKAHNDAKGKKGSAVAFKKTAPVAPEHKQSKVLQELKALKKTS